MPLENAETQTAYHTSDTGTQVTLASLVRYTNQLRAPIAMKDKGSQADFMVNPRTLTILFEDIHKYSPKKQIEILREKTQVLFRDYQSALIDFTVLEQNLQKSDEQNKQLIKKHKELEATNSDLITLNDILMKSSKEIQDKFQQLNIEILSLSEAIALKEKQLQEKAKELKKASEAYDKKIGLKVKELDQEKERVKNALKTLNDSLLEKEKRISELTVRLDSAGKKSVDQASSIEKIKKMNADLQRKLNQSDSNKSAKESQLAEYKEKAQQMTSKHEEEKRQLDHEIDSSKEKIAALSSQIEELRLELQNQKSVIDKRNSEIISAENEIRQLRKDNGKLKDQKRRQEEKEMECQQALTAQQHHLEIMTQAFQAFNDKEIVFLNEKHHMKAHFEAIILKKDTEIGALIARMKSSNFEQEAAELNKDIAKRDQEITRLRQEIDRLTTENINFKIDSIDISAFSETNSETKEKDKSPNTPNTPLFFSGSLGYIGDRRGALETRNITSSDARKSLSF